MPKAGNFEYEHRFIKGKHYAVFRDGWECEQASEHFKHCWVACVGGYENAYELTTEWFHMRGRTAAGNEIGGL